MDNSSFSKPETTPGSAWVVSPSYDLVFFCTVWMLPLLIAAAAASSHSISTAFFSVWIYHLFVRLPHFAATVNVTYARREQREYYRRHWLRFYLVPAAILLLYGLLLIQGFYPDWVRSLLATVASVWGSQHIAMQNYGILQLYNSRSQARPSLWTLRLEKGIFYAIFLGIYINGWVSGIASRFDATGWTTDGLPELIVNNVLIWLIGIELVRRWNAGTLISPTTLYLVTSIVAMYRWSFYDRLPDGSWFFVFNGHHCIAYVGLVFMMHWNERYPDQPLTLQSAASRYVRYFVPLVLVSLAAMLLTGVYSQVMISHFEIDFWALTGIFVVHYYLESQVWRFSRKHNRETTLKLLRQPTVI